MKKYLIYTIVALALFGCSNQNKNQVDQIILMIGSDPYDFDESTTMTKLSEGGGFGVGGEDWGGAVTILVDSQERDKPDSGGNIYVLDPHTRTIKLNGKVSEDLYLGVVFQHFDKWPDDFDGVLIIKEKINAGEVNEEYALVDLTSSAKKILNQ
jgi:hypothetical protein